MNPLHSTSKADFENPGGNLLREELFDFRARKTVLRLAVTPLERVTRETRPKFVRLWNYISWVFSCWNGTIRNTSLVWFMVLSPKIDIICVQTFAGNCCNFGVWGHRHIGLFHIQSNLGTRNLLQKLGEFLDPLNSRKPKYCWHKNSNRETIRFTSNLIDLCRAISARGSSSISTVIWFNTRLVHRNQAVP